MRVGTNRYFSKFFSKKSADQQKLIFEISIKIKCLTTACLSKHASLEIFANHAGPSDYESDDNATAADSWNNPDLEPVPMAPLPTAAPSNQVGNTQLAGPSAEGLANGPIAQRLRPSMVA